MGCHSNSDRTSEDSANEIIQMMMPTLSVDGHKLWDFKNSSIDTLSKDSHTFSFGLNNYMPHTDSVQNKNALLKLKGIKMTFAQDNKVHGRYSADIKDFGGSLTLDFDSMNLIGQVNYQVDMLLKFQQTDSTFSYTGKLYIGDGL